jgi:hypothetical protein
MYLEKSGLIALHTSVVNEIGKEVTHYISLCLQKESLINFVQFISERSAFLESNFRSWVHIKFG